MPPSCELDGHRPFSSLLHIPVYLFKFAAMSSAQDGRRGSLFPNARLHVKRTHPETTRLPYRPAIVSPVSDTDHAGEPLKQFDEVAHRNHYTNPATNHSESELKISSYLPPTLARNERQRLTMLWYLTNEIMDDAELLQRLQDIIGLVHTFLGREMVSLTLVAENACTIVATHGMSLAVIPRRETICAHTISQAYPVR